MPPNRISAHYKYTDEQLLIARQAADILGTPLEDLVGKANHPGKIDDLKPAKGSVMASHKSSDDRSVSAQVSTMHHVPREHISNRAPLLNHNIQNAENSEESQIDDELFHDFIRSSAWLQGDVSCSEAGLSTPDVGEGRWSDVWLRLQAEERVAHTRPAVGGQIAAASDAEGFVLAWEGGRSGVRRRAS